MTDLFTGKAGIVTGASSGIGRCIAHKLGQAGMELWLVGRSAAELEATAETVRELGGLAAHCVPMDLAERGQLATLVTEVGTSHPYLFTVINNAGVMYPEPIVDSDPARWHEMIAINLMSPMESCHAAVQRMRAHGRPAHIINVSSVASREECYGAYGVSKLALNHMGRTLRRELEHDDIRVTTIVPGGFVTNLARGFAPETVEKLIQASSSRGVDPADPEMRKYMGDPDHIANLVVYILQQPIELNFEEITIRPAIATSLE